MAWNSAGLEWLRIHSMFVMVCASSASHVRASRALRARTSPCTRMGVGALTLLPTFRPCESTFLGED